MWPVFQLAAIVNPSGLRGHHRKWWRAHMSAAITPAPRPMNCKASQRGPSGSAAMRGAMSMGPKWVDCQEKNRGLRLMPPYSYAMTRVT